MRLNLYLAKCGVASRRKADEFILSGRVSINGKIVRQLGTQIKQGKDEISFDNQLLKPISDYKIILLNKPKGFITTVSDPFNRPTVMELVPQISGLVPVGRLDFDTEGVLLLSNLGELNYRLTHPKYQIEKIYFAKLDQPVKKNTISQLQQGVDIGEKRKVRASNVTKVDSDSLKLTLHEGKKRQVKRMFQALNYRVNYLQREQFAFLNCKKMELSSWRYLTNQEINKLKKMVEF